MPTSNASSVEGGWTTDGPAAQREGGRGKEDLLQEDTNGQSAAISHCQKNCNNQFHINKRWEPQISSASKLNSWTSSDWLTVKHGPHQHDYATISALKSIGPSRRRKCHDIVA